MRLDQNVGHGDLVREIRPPSTPRAGVLMIADKIPRPTVKRPLLNAGDIIRRKIVTQQIALVRGAVDDAGAGLHRQSRTIADT